MHDPVKRIVAVLTVLAVLVPLLTWLLLVFRDAVRDAFVVPLLYAAWLGGLTFRSIDQAVFWGLLIALTAILLFSSVRPQPEPRGPFHWTSEQDRRESRRIALWARQLVGDGNDLLWDFQSRVQFRNLIVAVWAFHRHANPTELEQELKKGAFELPPELRAYFEEDRRPHEAGTRFAKRVVGWLRVWVGMAHPATRAASEATLSVAIRTLEAEFGVDGQYASVNGADRGSKPPTAA